MQITIDFEDTQVSRLDAYAEAERISRTEAVKRAIQHLLDRKAASLGTGFGLWVHDDILVSNLPFARDAVVLQHSMRDERDG